jgi:hypothetical protein
VYPVGDLVHPRVFGTTGPTDQWLSILVSGTKCFEERE